jgi:hypothetical protein
MELSKNHNFVNLTGKVFGRLTVVEYAGYENRKTHWYCKCDCGTTLKVLSNSLQSGNTKSCGCLTADVSKITHTKHSLSKTRLYKTWQEMLQRCNNPNEPAYKDYGARGITVCKEWKDYMVFHNWAANNGYENTLTIERKNVNGNYEPNNCKWATIKEQQNNKRTCIFITFRNKTQSLNNWSIELNMSYSALIGRCRLGWSIDKMFNTPSKERSKNAKIYKRSNRTEQNKELLV